MVVIWPVMVKICSVIGDLRVVMGDVWPAIDNVKTDMLYKIYFFIYFELI